MNQQLYNAVSQSYAFIFNKFNLMLDNIIQEEKEIGFQPEECQNVLPI